jgi:hypothetical protein
MKPSEVSQAWEYLAQCPQPTQWEENPRQPRVPRNLRRLSDADWYLLSNLLSQAMYQKEQASLH